MYYHQFHDLPVSALGIGSLRLPAKPEDPNCIDREKAQKVIDYALGHGINFVDTAYTYHEGDSERFLGEALKKHKRSSYYPVSYTHLDVYKRQNISHTQTDDADPLIAVGKFSVFHSRHSSLPLFSIYQYTAGNGSSQILLSHAYLCLMGMLGSKKSPAQRHKALFTPTNIDFVSRYIFPRIRWDCN